MTTRGTPDLARDRILAAALRLFADRGVEAPSVRDVARAAGVSPGLVQHHFKTKGALRAAVDAQVFERVSAELATVAAERVPSERARGYGLRTIALMRGEPAIVDYLCRAFAGAEPAALELFDAFVSLARRHVDDMAVAGAVRADADLDWVALHVVLADLVAVLLAPAIDRHLHGEPLLSDRGLARWQGATEQLFTEGFFPGGGG